MHTVYYMAVVSEFYRMKQRAALRRYGFFGEQFQSIHHVHTGLRHYDLTLETTTLTPFKAAELVLEYVQQHSNPKGFEQMRAELATQSFG